MLDLMLKYIKTSGTPISLNHDDLSLLFKLSLFDFVDFIVWNIKGELLEFEPKRNMICKRNVIYSKKFVLVNMYYAKVY